MKIKLIILFSLPADLKCNPVSNKEDMRAAVNTLHSSVAKEREPPLTDRAGSPKEAPSVKTTVNEVLYIIAGVVTMFAIVIGVLLRLMKKFNTTLRTVANATDMLANANISTPRQQQQPSVQSNVLSPINMMAGAALNLAPPTAASTPQRAEPDDAHYENVCISPVPHPSGSSTPRQICPIQGSEMMELTRVISSEIILANSADLNSASTPLDQSEEGAVGGAELSERHYDNVPSLYENVTVQTLHQHVCQSKVNEDADVPLKDRLRSNRKTKQCNC